MLQKSLISVDSSSTYGPTLNCHIVKGICVIGTVFQVANRLKKVCQFLRRLNTGIPIKSEAIFFCSSAKDTKNKFNFTTGSRVLMYRDSVVTGLTVQRAYNRTISPKVSVQYSTVQSLYCRYL